MFEEIPSRRITERREALKEALLAGLGIAGGLTEVARKGRIDFETLGWLVVFLFGVYSYWRKRHEDPWTPPAEDTSLDPGANG
jgi:hypothetical protein